VSTVVLTPEATTLPDNVRVDWLLNGATTTSNVATVPPALNVNVVVSAAFGASKAMVCLPSFSGENWMCADGLPAPTTASSSWSSGPVVATSTVTRSVNGMLTPRATSCVSTSMVHCEKPSLWIVLQWVVGTMTTWP